MFHEVLSWSHDNWNGSWSGVESTKRLKHHRQKASSALYSVYTTTLNTEMCQRPKTALLSGWKWARKRVGLDSCSFFTAVHGPDIHRRSYLQLHEFQGKPYLAEMHWCAGAWPFRAFDDGNTRIPNKLVVSSLFYVFHEVPVFCNLFLLWRLIDNRRSLLQTVGSLMSADSRTSHAFCRPVSRLQKGRALSFTQCDYS